METEKIETQTVSESYRLHRRFDRMARLINEEKMQRLMNSHVMIIGLGGVGSWAAESLARSGVGTLTLIDFDEVCITNTNRQLHTLSGVVGQKKSAVLAERLRKINPQARVFDFPLFYNAENSEKILKNLGIEKKLNYIVDAIDNVTAKCHLLAQCKSLGLPVVTSTGSGGRMDPTMIKVRDLAETTDDPLARAIRRILRQQYDFPEKGPYGISAVVSLESPTMPFELKYDGGKGFTCVCPQGNNGLNTCDNKNLILGSASYVTGTFGLVCASEVVKGLLENSSKSSFENT